MAKSQRPVVMDKLSSSAKTLDEILVWVGESRVLSQCDVVGGVLM